MMYGTEYRKQRAKKLSYITIAFLHDDAVSDIRRFAAEIAIRKISTSNILPGLLQNNYQIKKK